MEGNTYAEDGDLYQIKHTAIARNVPLMIQDLGRVLTCKTDEDDED